MTAAGKPGPTVVEYLFGMFTLCSVAGAILTFFGGVADLAWEIYHWARTGFWAPSSVIGSLNWLDAGVFAREPLTGIMAPRDWVGLARVADWFLNLPTFAALMLCVPALWILLAQALAAVGSELARIGRSSQPLGK